MDNREDCRKETSSKEQTASELEVKEESKSYEGLAFLGKFRSLGT